MTDMIPLSEAFMTRPGRYRLLRKGFERIGWDGRNLHLLEIGCSTGDAAAYVSGNGHNVTAIDLSEELIRNACIKHCESDQLRFVCEDAARLSFNDGSFDGIYCEAAFSPMKDKSNALKEYHRVLRDGGMVLVNDFVMKNGAGAASREEVIHIPCFAGLQTRECYERLFSESGFELIEYHEEYGELIGITAWLCKIYGVPPGEIGGYLSMYFHEGGDPCAICDTASNGDDMESIPEGTFFKRSDLSYCQMLFRRKDIGNQNV